MEVATSFKKMPIMTRFVGGDVQEWEQRGEATLGYTHMGNLHSVDVKNHEMSTTEAENL